MSFWSSRNRYILVLVPVVALCAVWAGTHRGGSPSAESKASMEAIGAATYQWQLYHGDSICPSIRRLVDGRFLDARAPKVDPWQQPFAIICMESGATVLSFGPDRKRGTKDDLTVFSPRISPNKGGLSRPQEP